MAHRNSRIVCHSAASLAAGVCLLCGAATGCNVAFDDNEPPTDREEDIGTVQDEIIDGTVTTRRPEIGFFSRGCTATLITPYYAITAAHCMNVNNYQDTGVRSSDVFTMDTSGSQPIARLYSFGSHFTEKIWNGRSSDVGLIRLRSNAPASSLARSIAISDVFPTGTESSVRFGYGCNTAARDGTGGGVKRYRAFTGLVSNMSCPGDSGGPVLFGTNDIDANPIWGITSGWSWDLSAGGYFDVVADASYHKKQIEGVMHAWDGPYEDGVDRYGADYAYYTSPYASTCRSLCIADARCRAWTQYGGTCFLKNAIPSWAPLAGAVSGVSPNVPSDVAEDGYDRPGATLYSFTFSGGDEVCRTQCSADYRCQAYVIEPGSPRTCDIKQSATTPTPRPGFRGAPKRGTTFEAATAGHVLYTTDYSTPSPEICQSQCAQDSRCQGWDYQGPAYNATTGVYRAPHCRIFDGVLAGGPFFAAGFVAGLKSDMYR